ncbi:MAG: beta-propeller domain-containing protein, partial [Methanospirillum sp.]|nr:beta-propeller domain-containing protein [Methanospirillum sp.]
MIPASQKGYLVIIILLAIISAGIVLATGTDAPEPALKEIKTAEEFQEYLENSTVQYRYNGVSGGRLGDVVFASDMAEAPVLSSAPETSVAKTSSLPAGGGAESYSTTNIQVAGVDEADFVKNDGRYIYLESGDTLTIVEAYPPEKGKIVAEIPVKGSVSELFLSGDRLVIFTDSNDESWYTPEGSAVPVPDNQQNCHAIIYDISDRGNPREIRDISAPGRYEDARMISDYVYFISEDTPDYSHPTMPVIYDGTKAVDSPHIWCPPYPMNEYQLHTVTSFPVTGYGGPEAESFLLG